MKSDLDYAFERAARLLNCGGMPPNGMANSAIVSILTPIS
jgi:hypothetical protein